VATAVVALAGWVVALVVVGEHARVDPPAEEVPVGKIKRS